jgi:hypothetical protein
VFTITSNIPELIQELEAAEAAIKETPGHVLQPSLYKSALVERAALVLSQLTEEEERDAIPAMLATIEGWADTLVMTFEMRAPRDIPEGGMTPDDMDWGRFREDIEEWVREYKIRTERDVYKGRYGKGPGAHKAGEPISDSAIATRLQFILGGENSDSFFAIDEPGHGQLNDTGLVAFLREKHPELFSSLTGLSDLRLTELLAAVLVAWRELMGVRVVAEALRHINKALGPNT